VTQLEEIYKNYFKHVYLYIYSLSGNKHIAEDITSETFMKAISSIDSYRGYFNIWQGSKSKWWFSYTTKVGFRILFNIISVTNCFKWYYFVY
jgi:DNA-directed RNA polymerase specialized sigma24 family protein